MKDQNIPFDGLLKDLKERAKELNCLYEVIELTNKPKLSIDDVLNRVVQVIPAGWQYPQICHAKIVYDDKTYASPNCKETPWVIQSPIKVNNDELVGFVAVCYSDEMPAADEGPFLKEERKLLDNIADRLGQFLLHRRLGELFHQTAASKREPTTWKAVIDLL